MSGLCLLASRQMATHNDRRWIMQEITVLYTNGSKQVVRGVGVDVDLKERELHILDDKFEACNKIDLDIVTDIEIYDIEYLEGSTFSDDKVGQLD